jgi:hypothetical protein
MKEKYRVFNNSNIFLRDIQYSIKSYFDKKNRPVKIAMAEKIAWQFIESLEKGGELKKISENAWKVNFSFDKSVTEVTTPEKSEI